MIGLMKVTVFLPGKRRLPLGTIVFPQNAAIIEAL
jgi:hypothetical protein